MEECRKFRKLKELATWQRNTKHWISKHPNLKVLSVNIVLHCKIAEKPSRMIRWCKPPLEWRWDSLEWSGGLEGWEGCPKAISAWVETHPHIKVSSVEVVPTYEDGGEKVEQES